MTDDFTPLTNSNHWLGWVGDDPAQAVRGEIEGILRQQVPSAKLAWIHLNGDPYFLTGGRKAPDDPGKIVVSRAALAVSFELEVTSADRTDHLHGVFSWVVSGLDDMRRDRVYFDIDADLASASEQLKIRIYELDAVARRDEHP
jgi:hypothetical protein